MINVSEAAKEVEKFNSEIGYVASKLEIANDIWNCHMNPADRLEIMNTQNLVGLTALQKLRQCVKALSEMF
jgi:hypothetical protein